jgi:ribulose-5-phosphate 4-epimerase/fuculose-1-phosphate aldolase
MDSREDAADFVRDDVRRLREDLALALRAAAHHGLAEGVCNHFSVEVPGVARRFLLNPRGLLWGEVQPDDIVMVDAAGRRLAGRHDVEPTAMFIHAAVHRLCAKACVLHTHMPYATTLTLTSAGGLDTTLSQNAMRFHGRTSIDRLYNGLALDGSEGERIATAIGAAHAYDDLYYLERACQAQVLALSTGMSLAPVDPDLAASVCRQTLGERLQSELFFEALRRTV